MHKSAAAVVVCVLPTNGKKRYAALAKMQSAAQSLVRYFLPKHLYLKVCYMGRKIQDMKIIVYIMRVFLPYRSLFDSVLPMLYIAKINI